MNDIEKEQEYIAGLRDGERRRETMERRVEYSAAYIAGFAEGFSSISKPNR